MKTSNRSVSFNSERGRDIYVEDQRIIIHISPDSCPLLNCSDSYLMFSLLLGNDKLGTANPNYVIPDPAIGGSSPFASCTIRSGDGATVLEQMDSMEIWTALAHKYGSNQNDEQLRNIYEGRAQLINDEYRSDNAIAPVAATRRVAPTSANGKWASRGGGFGSQYYVMRDNNNVDNSRKAQMIYRFPMSGLLSSMRSELTPIIALQGLIIELNLIESSKLLRVQQVAIDDAGTATTTEIGYGVQGVGANLSVQGLVGAAQLFTATQSCYGLYGSITAAGPQAPGAIPAGTAITGLVLNNSTSGSNKYKVDDIQNCSIKVGSKIRVGYTPIAPVTCAQTTGALIDSVVTNVSIVGGRIHISFPAFTTQAAVGATTGIIPADAPIMCSLTSAGTPTFADAARSANTPAELTMNRHRFEVSDVEFVANVVEAPLEYTTALVNQARTGKLKIQYNSYTDVRVNVPIGALQNEMFIPTDLQRCYSMFGVNEILRSHNYLMDSFSPSVANLRDYIFIFDGIRTPNQAVKLGRMATGRVNALAVIELEKALGESSIPLKDLRNPSKFICIARRLGAYGSSVTLLNKIIKCRVSYTNEQPLALLYHWFIYHTKSIQFEGNSIIVVE